MAARLIARWKRRPRAAPDWLLTEVTAVLATRPGAHLVLADPPVPQWRWPVEPWADLGTLALGLDLRQGELDWFADRGGWLHRAPEGPLHHYRRRWVLSRSGSPRLLETPAPRLQELQRRIAGGCSPASPSTTRRTATSAGARPSRSPRCTRGGRWSSASIWRGSSPTSPASGWPGCCARPGTPAVAAAIAGLLVTTTPVAVLRAAPGAASEPRRRLLDRLTGPHLPQGAPTSPAAANLLAHRLDRRVAGLAAAVGAEYGRYADDLVLSGDATLPTGGLVKRITEIAAEEGFRVRPDKTRVMPAHHRQRVTGLVVNDRPAGVPARLRRPACRAAQLRSAPGPDTQNRDGHPAFRDHLSGRIAWVSTGRPRREAVLLDLFDAISW